MEVSLRIEWTRERGRRLGLSSNVKPDPNIAHRRQYDASDGDGFWFSSLAVVGFIFSGRRRRRRCRIVPKDVLRHRSGRNKSADKEN